MAWHGACCWLWCLRRPPPPPLAVTLPRHAANTPPRPCWPGPHRRAHPHGHAAARELATTAVGRKGAAPVLDVSGYGPDLVRNFSIIAHIDHGKSTLADRLLELAGTISASSANKQVLDKLQVEQERGITVKAQTASLFCEHEGRRHLLNLIDTPGHADFSYEVSCSLSACQGTLLVVDAAQGIQAQTLANFYLAFERDLAILPVINKIDLPGAEVEKTIGQLKRLFDFDESDVLLCSAKSGFGVDTVLPAIIEAVPPPPVSVDAEFHALLFDSWFDEYRGVVTLIEVMAGSLAKGDKITSAHTDRSYDVLELGLMYPGQTPCSRLSAGQVGYVIAGMKSTKEARVGDTLHHRERPVEPLPGFQPAKPMVFAGVFPVEARDYEQLDSALSKLTLNDASVSVRKDMSPALGAGWRIGFLGMLHLDVFRQRLEQEHGAEVLVTSPSVAYQIQMTQKADRALLTIECPSEFPEDVNKIHAVMEPMVLATLVFPGDYIGSLIDLCERRRGTQVSLEYIDDNRVMLKYRLPLNEIVENFYDHIKALSSGYATFDYEEAGYEPSDIVKLQLLLNGEPLDALSMFVHRSLAHTRGKDICAKLKTVIPRQLFDVAIQAAVGGKIMARETVKAVRKDVTAKCYGGDITRKMKLLNQQKEGKKKMRTIGRVQLPKEAFLNVVSK